MASTFENPSSFANYLPSAATIDLFTSRQVYEENRHHIYALAFWMTDNELMAEELMENVFRQAFHRRNTPSAEALDRILIVQLRSCMRLGELTLNCAPSTEVVSVRRNTLRTHLERAVVQLPATERLIFLLHDVEGYEHERIAALLGLYREKSQYGLHQARLRIRELLASMGN